MVHYTKTADIKEAANRQRRIEAKLIVQSDIKGMLDDEEGEQLPIDRLLVIR